MKRIVRVFSIVCILVLLVATTAFAGGTQAKTSTEGKVTLTWLQHWDPEVGTELMDGIQAKFSELHPGVGFDRQTTPFGTLYDKLIILAQAKQLPDMWALNGNWIPPLESLGAIESLESRLVNEGLKDKLAFLETYKNQEWVVDVYGGPVIIFCNRDLFKQAGLSYPTTWDEYLAVSRKLTDPGKNRYATAAEMGFEDNGGLFYWYWPLMYSAGGRGVGADGKLDYNTRPGVQTLEFLATMYNEKLLLPGTLSNTQKEKREAFVGQTIAMQNEGPWGPGILKQMNVSFEYDIIKWIRGPRSRGGIAAGTGVSMSSSSKNKDLAWEFIKFITVGEGNKMFVESTGNTSNYKPHLELEYIKKDPKLASFAAQLAEPGNGGVPIVPDQVTLEKFLLGEIQQHLSGKKSAQQALDDVVKQYEEALAKKQ
jgi:ABC-type glycerol-3-phosphate transport system substrate-binding protein